MQRTLNLSDGRLVLPQAARDGSRPQRHCPLRAKSRPFAGEPATQCVRWGSVLCKAGSGRAATIQRAA